MGHAILTAPLGAVHQLEGGVVTGAVHYMPGYQPYQQFVSQLSRNVNAGRDQSEASSAGPQSATPLQTNLMPPTFIHSANGMVGVRVPLTLPLTAVQTTIPHFQLQGKSLSSAAVLVTCCEC